MKSSKNCRSEAKKLGCFNDKQKIYPVTALISELQFAKPVSKKEGH
jgi:hypothetical protein